MTGDGVNVVFLDESFAALPYVLAEGRRVLGNIERVASLFLVTTMYSLTLASSLGPSRVARRASGGESWVVPHTATEEEHPMTDIPGTDSSPSQQAWSKLADQFALIAQQFRQHYERVSASSQPETEKAQGSVERAVTMVGKAIEDTARAIDQSVSDPKVREDSAQAGSALLRAVGATLTELGAALQRE